MAESVQLDFFQKNLFYIFKVKFVKHVMYLIAFNPNLLTLPRCESGISSVHQLQKKLLNYKLFQKLLDSNYIHRHTYINYETIMTIFNIKLF